MIVATKSYSERAVAMTIVLIYFTLRHIVHSNQQGIIMCVRRLNDIARLLAFIQYDRIIVERRTKE